MEGIHNAKKLKNFNNGASKTALIIPGFIGSDFTDNYLDILANNIKNRNVYGYSHVNHYDKKRSSDDMSSEFICKDIMDHLASYKQPH